MINHAVARILLAGGVAGGVLFSELAAAIDWNFTGLFRQEIAYSIASNNNEMNSMGSVFNDRIVPHYTNASFNAGNAKAPARANPRACLPSGLRHELRVPSGLRHDLRAPIRFLRSTAASGTSMRFRRAVRAWPGTAASVAFSVPMAAARPTCPVPIPPRAPASARRAQA